MMRRSAFLLLLLVCAPLALAQMAPKRTAIRAGRLIDGRGGAPVSNAPILVEGDRMEKVQFVMKAGVVHKGGR